MGFADGHKAVKRTAETQFCLQDRLDSSEWVDHHEGDEAVRNSSSGGLGLRGWGLGPTQPLVFCP